MILPMPKASSGAESAATASSLVRHRNKKELTGTSHEDFQEARQLPTSDQTNGRDVIQSASMRQDQLYQFRSELEAMCAERMKTSEGQLEEKIKRMIEAESQVAKTRAQRIEDVQTELKERLSENNSTLRATKHDLEERLHSISNEFRFKEVELESGIQEIDGKLIEMRENVASHTQTLEQATESHLERISKSTSSSIKTIKELAEASSASLYKKYEDLCGKLLYALQQTPVVRKFVESTQREQTDSPSQPSQQSSGHRSQDTGQSSARRIDDDAKRGEVDSSMDQSSSRRKRSRPATANDVNLELKGVDEDAVSKEDKSGSKRRSTPDCPSGRKAKKTARRNGPAKETTPPPSRPKKPCVTPSGKKSQQIVTPSDKTPPNTTGSRTISERARNSGERRTTTRSRHPSRAEKEQQLVTPINKIPPTKGSRMTDEKVECGKRKSRAPKTPSLTEDADVVPFEIVTENCECPSPLGNMSAKVRAEPVEMIREVAAATSKKPKNGRRKRKKQTQHVYGTRSSATRTRIQPDDSFSFGRFS
jgi:hypothetical protein